MRSLRLRLLLVRGILGGLFVGHGAQKLFGRFGGHGPGGAGKFFENVGRPPGAPQRIAARAELIERFARWASSPDAEAPDAESSPEAAEAPVIHAPA